MNWQAELGKIWENISAPHYLTRECTKNDCQCKSCKTKDSVLKRKETAKNEH